MAFTDTGLTISGTVSGRHNAEKSSLGVTTEVMIVRFFLSAAL
jgi:hypothetical protein